jgi:eukaryotic-like serine/threonine-protein kinase
VKNGDRFGNYVVVERLGAGAAATVWRVRHTTLQSSHALKVLGVESATLRGRLVQEGRIQAELVHRHIVRVTDVVDLDGRVGLVMDFVEGVSLRELLQTEGKMGAPEALEIFRQVLSAIETAHAAGVLHRDLKPDNVLLSQEDDGVVARVTDFGIAKVLSGVLRPGDTRDGTMMGSPGYMAPEQIEDASSASTRSDLFAAGSILYEMLAGVPPFDGTAIERMDRTRSGTFVPLRKAAPAVPAHVADAVDACLQRDSGRRPASVADLRERLFPDGTLLDGSEAPPPTTTPAPSSAATSDAFARRLLVFTVVGSLLLVSAAVAFVVVAGNRTVSPPVATAPPVEAVTTPETRKPPTVRPGPTGKLTIEVRPTSTIRIDGATVGRGHYAGNVRAGAHLVELRTIDGRKLQERIEVEANGSTNFCWDFDANAECAP